MSGMTGYDQATSYPTAAQYNYVPNLQGMGLGGGGQDPGLDPRQLQQWHHQYQPHQMHQGHSPTTQRYPYYDRNGYYQHHQQQQLDWHEPVVSTAVASTAGTPGPGAAGTGAAAGAVPRPDSPGSVQQQLAQQQPTNHSFSSPPPPPQTSGVNQYSCKLAAGTATGPPSPTQQQQQQKTEPQQQQQHQYQQYQCPITPQSQVYNNNLPPQHNTYGLNEVQPSPVSGQGGGGGNGAGGGPGGGGPGGGPPQQQPPQAPLPSPLYPWMRSQFGKLMSLLCPVITTPSPVGIPILCSSHTRPRGS